MVQGHFFWRESTLFIAFARGYNLLSRVSFKNKAASFYTTIEPDSLKTVISLFLSNEISVSPHSGKNSMSFSSKAWKGIKAGLCNNWGKFSAKWSIHFRNQAVNKLTANSASSLIFWRFTIGNFIAGIVQMLTCEEVISVMPILVASLYRCSSTSTLVALQSRINFRTHSNWSANRNKNKWKKQKLHCDRIHTWCTRRGYQT